MAERDFARELTRLAEPIVSAEGAELVEVEVKGHTGSRVVRVIVDAEEGIDIDMIATLSRRIGAALDEDDIVPGRYTLQVTSPGADRPLRTERDFRRNIGRPVKVVHRTEDRTRETVGDLVAADAANLTLEVAGERVDLPLEDVDYGRVQLPW